MTADMKRARAKAKANGWDPVWIRSEADAVAVLKQDCAFNQARAEVVYRFFARLLRHSKGRWAGQPFTLLDWQWLDVIAPIYGWLRPDGTRRYRRAHVEIPKKNGKSTMAAGLSLYHLFHDGEAGAEVYNAASDRSQASIVFNEASNMLRSSPLLLKRVGPKGIIDSRKTIVDPKTNSRYQALSADVPTKEGLNISALIFDELHAQKNHDLWNTLLYGGAARLQPLMVSITTAGVFDETAIGWEQHEKARRVLDGTWEEDDFFAYVRAAGPKDDWTAPEVWAKANPSLDVTIRSEEMAEQCRAAQASVAEQNNFRRYRLNQWVQQAERVIDLQQWDKGAGHPIDELEYVGRTCYAGLDLSATEDLSAWALAFPCDDEDEAIDILVRAWVPEAKLSDPKNINRGLYQQMVADGLLMVSPGEVIDYRIIEAQVLKDAASFDLREINVDKKFQGQDLVNRLQDEGLVIYTFGQGFSAWAGPMRETMRLYRALKLHHGGNSVLRWAADNLSVRVGEQGDMVPVKGSGQKRRKIDPFVAMVMAIDRKIRHPDSGTTSAYDEHGVVFVPF